MTSAEILVNAITKVYKKGLTTTSGGNLSLRDGDGNIWITPSGKDKGTLKPEDIAKVSPNGDITGAYKPSMELPFHSLIYKLRPEINAVLHVHSPYLVSYSLMGKAPEVGVTPYTKFACGEVGLAGYDIPGSLDLGKKIAKEIERGFNAVMMQNHGVVVIAENMDAAFKKLEALELAAKINTYAKLLTGKFPPKFNAARLNEVAYTEACEVSEKPQNFEEFFARSVAQGYFLEGCGVISERAENGFNITNCNKYEYEVHANIYAERPDVNSVFTALPPAIAAFAVSGAELNSKTIPESYIMMRDIVRLSVGEELNAGKLTSARKPVALSPAMLIATGENITKAFDRMEVSEITAKNLLIAKILGDVINITPAEIDKIDSYFNLI